MGLGLGLGVGTAKERGMNNKLMYTFNGVTQDKEYWAKVIGVSVEALRYRIERWGVELALSTPKNKRATAEEIKRENPEVKEEGTLWGVYRMPEMLAVVVEKFKHLPKIVMREGRLCDARVSTVAPPPKIKKLNVVIHKKWIPGRKQGSINKNIIGKEQAVLEMYTTEQHSRRQIAISLNISERTVRTIIERARIEGRCK